MKLILTSDLHRDGAKLLWFLENAPPHDAIIVAGDHLNMFSNVRFAEQKNGAMLWKNAVLESGRSLAWSSGNHDFFHGDSTPMTQASPQWMREIPSDDVFVTDGESRLLNTPSGEVAVTTIPWPACGTELVLDGFRTPYMDFAKRLLRDGRALQELGAPWIVLNHEPPESTPLAAWYEDPLAHLARRVVEAAKPDFSLHGHIHQAPNAAGGSWIWQTGESRKTVAFNPGQSRSGELPQYVMLEWSGRGEWTATWDGPLGTDRVGS